MGSVTASNEPFDERQRGRCDLLPTVIDRQRVSAIRHLDELGYAGVALLDLIRRLGDRARNRVVFLT